MKTVDSYLLGYHARVHDLTLADVQKHGEDDLAVEDEAEFQSGWDTANGELCEPKFEALRDTLREIGELDS